MLNGSDQAFSKEYDHGATTTYSKTWKTGNLVAN